MKISEHIEKKENCITYGVASITNYYLVPYGSEHFYQYIGKLGGITFTDYVHPDDVEEFKSVFENLELNESARIILRIKNSLDEYYWSDMVLTNNGNSMANDPVIDVTIYFLSAIESRYILAKNNMNKYRQFISIYRDLIFDYDVEFDRLTIYVYHGSQTVIVYKGPLSQFKDNLMPLLESASERIDLEHFCNNIKKASGTFTCNVTLPIDNEFKKLRRFRVSSSVSYKENRCVIVVGVLKQTDELEAEEIPYYSTKEALDSATSLLNKRATYEYCLALLENNKEQNHYMIIIDIDNFKSINDNYGHMFGDEVILKVSTVINSILNGRAIVGRFGGDEFFIFTTNLRDESELRVILTTIRKELYYAYDYLGDNFHVTLSAGISLYPTDGLTYEDLFKKADKCLYLAKNKGRNRYIIYDEEKHGQITETADRVHKALNLNDRAEYLATYVAQATLELGNKGISAIANILNDIRSKMDIDGIRIISENDADNPVYLSGDYRNLPVFSPFCKDEKFLMRFNSNNVLMVNGIDSFEPFHKTFCQELNRCNIMAFNCFLVTNPAGERFFIFFDIFNHKNRWNETDKNYLLILSRIISGYL